MPPARRLLRRDRQGQSRPCDQNDQDAGRRVRRGSKLARFHQGDCVSFHPATEARNAAQGASASHALGIEALSMTKRFGTFTALDQVSLKVPAGSFHALLGENGAGKSTLVKCVMGYYRADEGELVVGDRQEII